MKVEAMEVAAAKAGSTISLSGTITTFFAWATSNEGLGLLGLGVSVIGLFVMWYYKREADKRADAEVTRRQAEHELRMSLMRASGKPIFHEDTDLGKLEATSE